MTKTRIEAMEQLKEACAGADYEKRTNSSGNRILWRLKVCLAAYRSELGADRGIEELQK